MSFVCVGITYFHGLGKRSSRRPEQSGGLFQASAADFGHRKRTTFWSSFVLALPIFTARHQATIVGVSELNFCVRDGNRWTLTTINTNLIWL